MSEAERLRRLCTPPIAIEWLDNCQDWLAKFIRPHVVEDGRRHFALDLGEGWQGYANPDQFDSDVIEQQVIDACDCMHLVRIIRMHIADDSTLDGDLSWILNHTFAFGVKFQKLRERATERQAKRFDAILQGASQGGQLNAKLKPKQKKEIRSTVSRRMAKGEKKQSICKELAPQIRRQLQIPLAHS